MMDRQFKVSGVVLAGGQARRMQLQDKGLQLLKGKALVSYILAALVPLVDEVFISANRNQATYSQFGYPVLADHNQNYEGPLAGILAAMQYAQYPVLLVAPCDAPRLQSIYLQRLLSALSPEIDVSIAFDGERIHPVCMAVKTNLSPHLQAFLGRGERKMQLWISQQKTVQVDFSDAPEIFANINTLAELASLEAQML
jgi:molybdopterin-guanine dinucleotide biosynthesis protein A